MKAMVLREFECQGNLAVPTWTNVQASRYGGCIFERVRSGPYDEK